MITCNAPIPKINFAMDTKRSYDNSKPMLKSKKITPNSASTFTCETCVIIPVAYGPINAPPSKKPTTGDPPGTFETAYTQKMAVIIKNSASRIPVSSASCAACLAIAFSDSGTSCCTKSVACDNFPLTKLVVVFAKCRYAGIGNANPPTAININVPKNLFMSRNENKNFPFPPD